MNGSLEGMTPEDAFALGIQKGMALLKELGRNGDSELAHVNPEEKEMLESQGGAGTTNPATGMPEFFSSDMENERGRDAGVGGNDRASAGRDDRSDMERERGRQSGVRGATPESQRSGEPVSTNPTSAGGTVSDMEANRVQSNPADDRSLGERLADGLEAAFGGNQFGTPNKTDPGFLGGMAGMAPGIGWGLAATRALQAMGVPNREKQPGELGTDEYSGQRDDKILSPNQKPAQQNPNQTPQNPWQRPGEQPQAPGGLNFDGGMTPFQQRSQIATFGTQGDAGLYRDPAVVDFYRNLALYDLTTPGGGIAEGAKVLPIEQQYLSQVTGANPGSSVEEFLKALNGI